MKPTAIARTLAVIFTFFAIARLEARPEEISQLNQFDIQKEPQREDWKFFHSAPERVRYDLWQYHRRQGHTLASWAWGWRLGWVRACALSTKKYCSTLLQRALHDDALVVRAEAATVIGRRFEGSGNVKAVAALVKAYAQHENYRRGRPLFVTQRILFAIYRIGGQEALTSGAKLAASHPQTRDYWGKILR